MVFWPLLYLLLVFGLVWLCWPVEEPRKIQQVFVLLLVAKLALGLLATYLFYYRYTGDISTYHQKASILNSIADEDPVRYLRIIFLNQVDSRGLRQILDNWYTPSFFFMVKAISLQSLLTQGSAWLNSLLFSVFGFLGQWRLWREVTYKWKPLEKPFFAAFFLVPSVVFWSSGITKETLLLGGLGFVFAALLQLSQRRWPTFPAWLGVAVSVFVLWQVRYFFLLLLLACLGAYWLHRWLAGRLSLVTVKSRALLFLVLLVVASAVVSRLHPNFTADRVVVLVMKSYWFTVERSSPESLIHYNLEPTVASLLLNSPKAMVTALYRPFLWESRSALLLVTAIENTALLLLTIGALLHLRTRKRNRSEPEPGLVWAMLAFVLIMAAMLALNAPNYGTLIRYRAGILPFFVLILLSGGWWNVYWLRGRALLGKRKSGG